MSARLWRAGIGRRTAGGLVSSALVLATAAYAQLSEPEGLTPAQRAPARPMYVIPGPTQSSTLYADGSQIEVQTEEIWSLMCGSDATGVSSADLRTWAEAHQRSIETGPLEVVGGSMRSVGITVNFSVDATVPMDARAALALAKAYLENTFMDPITVSIFVSFQDLGGSGVIGATSNNYIQNISYTVSRAGLVNGMDADDEIQSWLPLGATCPVRFNGGSPTITNKNEVDWTKANYIATVGTSPGPAASMAFNTQFAPNFDYDPSDGVPIDKLSFVDTVIHEVGHVLGFISGVDNFNNVEFAALDLFRFQISNYNPSTFADFQTFPRLVSFNNPNDDVMLDMILAEYRMEDGNPWQASHFREEPPYVGIMQPAQSDGETHYPHYYSTADLAAFDAIGFEICRGPVISQQPVTHTGYVGLPTSFSITAAGAGTLQYQWRKGGVNLTDGGNISGATTATLTIDPVGRPDWGSYDVYITDLCGASASLPGTLWLAGDMTCDGVVNFGDINSFVQALASRIVYESQHPNCLWFNADCNNDGAVNFADINPFVAVLSQP